MDGYQFKLGMYLPELRLPFEEAVLKAREIGAEYVWYSRMPGEPALGQMSNAEADYRAKFLESHGLKLFLISAGGSFKQLHLCDLNLENMENHHVFRQELDNLTRGMEIAARLGVGTVGTFSFAWPGEYTAGKPTWPMRWLTRGGVIADIDMEKLVKAFSLILEKAECFGVDLAIGMMPWNYTNTTGNFCRLAEKLNSRRIKVMWGPADNLNCGESDVATSGFHAVRPYLHGLHLKDLRVVDGLHCKFDYCPIGTGDVDYPKILHNLRTYYCDAVLSVSTHFLTLGGTPEEAMRINYENLKDLIEKDKIMR